MISAEQVTALTAQTAKQVATITAQVVGNAVDENGNLQEGWVKNLENDNVYIGSLLNITGVGVYGQSPANLVAAGFVKPGALNIITAPEMVASVLNSPSVWTGLYGVNSLLDYLDYPLLQNLTQIALLSGAYQSLVSIGLLQGTETSRYQASFVQPAAQYGIANVVAWVNNTLTDTDVAINIIIASRQGQYAIDFVDANAEKLNLLSNQTGYGNTVQRDDIDNAVSSIIDNEKIPPLDYAEADDPTVDPEYNVVPTTLTIKRLNGQDIPEETNEDGTFRFAPNNLNR